MIHLACILSNCHFTTHLWIGRLWTTDSCNANPDLWVKRPKKYHKSCFTPPANSRVLHQVSCTTCVVRGGFCYRKKCLEPSSNFSCLLFFLYAHGIMSYVHFPPFYPQVCLPPVFIFPWLSWLPSTSPILPLRKPCQFKSMTLCDLGRAPDKWMEIYIKTASVCINVCVCVCVCVCVGWFPLEWKKEVNEGIWIVDPSFGGCWILKIQIYGYKSVVIRLHCAFGWTKHLMWSHKTKKWLPLIWYSQLWHK